jgi:hypothetical protein
MIVFQLLLTAVKRLNETINQGDDADAVREEEFL